jgi:lipopolysaccharide biosynthesis glycosyltransferase
MSKINIAFCFDENLWMQAGVSIISLLYNSKGKCSYNIHCVVSNAVHPVRRRELEKIVNNQDPLSSIIFLEANHDFDQSHFSRFSVGMYYRLMLPKLLPHLDKIIYSDVDVIFCKDMIEADQIDLGDHWIAGVKDEFNLKGSESVKKIKCKALNNGKYICSGFLIMNLKELRKGDTYNLWVALSRNKIFNTPDQDILNYTCPNKKIFVPLKYSLQPKKKKDYDECIEEHIFSRREYEEALNNPVAIHYATRKPWNNTIFLGEIWWIYAKMTPFFEIFKLKNFAPYADLEKYFYLLHCIPFLRVKITGNKVKYYLFGFIPLLKIKNQKPK